MVKRIRGPVLAAAMIGLAPASVSAQPVPNPGVPFARGYAPDIWVDPDGCQHWVMDGGYEGFMSQRLDRNGKPVCEEVIGCGTLDSDVLFAVDRSTVVEPYRSRLTEFFQLESARGTSFVIRGHTDSTWTEDYNMALSQRRADSVAALAEAAGGEVTTEAFGETMPVADNATAEGRRLNRRVEIVCQ